MQRPLQITFHGIERSDAVERRVRSKAEELERCHEHIIGCHVTVDAAHHHRHQGGVYAVRLDIRVPDGQVVVNRERHLHHAHEDVYVAIRDAFEAAARQLVGHTQRQQGKVKQHELPNHGKVVNRPLGESYAVVEASDQASGTPAPTRGTLRR